jgi:alpha-beta hydrolase superfamily lysophospholipase
MKLLYATLSLLLMACAANPAPQREPASASPMELKQMAIDGLLEKQRVGMMLEAEGREFQGCVIYLEGFGDSIRNHLPLFHHLANAGYRVLAFDYLGQGGSEGSMDNMRLDSMALPLPVGRAYEISAQAKWVWNYFSRTPDLRNNRTCAHSPKLVIGWSTGGLAAYRLAEQKWADAVALIEPTVIPKTCVGASANVSFPECLKKIFSNPNVITVHSLTSENYTVRANPHIDPIKPFNLLGVMGFGINLNTTAKLLARFWRIDPRVKGIVFLGGKNDTFSDPDATSRLLEKNAPHFTLIRYEQGLHELDNEVPAISENMRDRTVNFFDLVERAR